GLLPAGRPAAPATAAGPPPGAAGLHRHLDAHRRRCLRGAGVFSREPNAPRLLALPAPSLPATLPGSRRHSAPSVPSAPPRFDAPRGNEPNSPRTHAQTRAVERSAMAVPARERDENTGWRGLF